MKFTCDFSFTSPPHRLRSSWLPSSLFRAGEAGAWYDPSDLMLLAQVAAGTVPVTAASQPVGLMQDKSGHGCSAGQSVSAARPTSARRPVGGRRNKFTYTEALDNAAWSKIRTSVFANAVTAPDGTATADKLIEDATASASHLAIAPAISFVAGTSYAISVYAKAAGRAQVGLNFPAGVGGGLDNPALFDLTSGVVVSSGGFSATAITATANGWYRCMAQGTPVSACTGNSILRLASGGSTSYTGDGVSGACMWGTQIEAASTATSYQKVVSAYDVTEDGAADIWHLAFDQVDDALSVTLPDLGTHATLAYASHAGVTILSGQTISGLTPLPTPARLGPVVYIDRALNAAEAARLTTYLSTRAPL